MGIAGSGVSITPQHGIQPIVLFIPKLHPALHDLDAFRRQARALQSILGRGWRQPQMPIRTQDAMPRQIRLIAGGQNARHQACTARKAGAPCDGSVTGHLPRRHRADLRQNALTTLCGIDHGGGHQHSSTSRNKAARISGSPDLGPAMLNFEQIRAHAIAQYTVVTNDPFLIGVELTLDGGNRRQNIYLAELQGEDGRNYLRVSTSIAPITGVDARRALFFNWEQRVGYLALTDLDGVPYLHLCENRPYEVLTAAELDRVVLEVGGLGDRMERTFSAGGDLF